MLLVYAALLILATVPLAGGSLAALADVRLRGAWLVALALGVQVLITTVLPGMAEDLFRVVHAATYGPLGGFLWLNRRLPGVWIAAVVAAGGPDRNRSYRTQPQPERRAETLRPSRPQWAPGPPRPKQKEGWPA